MKKLISFLLIAIFLVLGTACGASGDKSAVDGGADYEVGQDDKASVDGNVVPDLDVELQVDKIIKSGSISLYTEDYKTTAKKIEDYVTGIGGFIQSSNDSYVDYTDVMSDQRGSLVVRVPSDKFMAAMAEIKSYGRSVGSTTNSENISETYQDVESELKSFKVEEERLLTYLSKADKIEDMLNIEKELTRVRTEINSRTAILKNYDKLVAYSTISITLTENKSATGKLESPFGDFGDKIGSGFISSVNLLLSILAGLIVIFFQLLPFAAIAGVVLLVVWLVIRKNRNRKQ